jgi:hypothetical protein
MEIPFGFTHDRPYQPSIFYKEMWDKSIRGWHVVKSTGLPMAGHLPPHGSNRHPNTSTRSLFEILHKYHGWSPATLLSVKKGAGRRNPTPRKSHVNSCGTQTMASK